MTGPAITDLSTGDTITTTQPPVCCDTAMRRRPYTDTSSVWTCWYSEDTQIHVDNNGRITEQPHLTDDCEVELHV
ncbi:hypothetical protein ACWENO_13880 [Streptomyces sp. NPDC004436]